MDENQWFRNLWRLPNKIFCNQVWNHWKNFSTVSSGKSSREKTIFCIIIAIILILISIIFRSIVYYNNIKFFVIVYDKEQNLINFFLFFYSIIAMNYMIETFLSIIALIVFSSVIAGIHLEFKIWKIKNRIRILDRN
jgi:hypothetical protein